MKIRKDLFNVDFCNFSLHKIYYLVYSPLEQASTVIVFDFTQLNNRKISEINTRLL